MSMTTKSVFKLAMAALALTAVVACSSKPTQVASTPPYTPPPAQPTDNTPPPPPVERPLPPVGIVPGSQQDFVVNVGDRVYFDTDQSSIRADAQGILSAQAEGLNRYPAVKIRIEGNADERGTREYNFALGARRAESVSEFLVSKGVLPSRISTISYGKEQPIDPGDDESAWAKNRNAHSTLTSGAQ